MNNTALQPIGIILPKRCRFVSNPIPSTNKKQMYRRQPTKEPLPESLGFLAHQIHATKHLIINKKPAPEYPTAGAGVCQSHSDRDSASVLRFPLS